MCWRLSVASHRCSGMESAEDSSRDESDSKSEIKIGFGRGGRPAPLCGSRQQRKLRACGAIDCLSKDCCSISCSTHCPPWSTLWGTFTLLHCLRRSVIRVHVLLAPRHRARWDVGISHLFDQTTTERAYHTMQLSWLHSYYLQTWMTAIGIMERAHVAFVSCYARRCVPFANGR